MLSGETLKFASVTEYLCELVPFFVSLEHL